MFVRITSMLLRVFFLINLVLGILFWTNTAAEQVVKFHLVELHMLVGILFVVALWIVSAAQGLKGGSLGLVVGAFAAGLGLAIIGLIQKSTGMTGIIPALHILFFLGAMTLGEMSTRRYKKLTAAPAVAK